MTARVCVVTGSRAEYGLFRPLLRELDAHPLFEVGLAVTGQHLAEAFGSTVHEIEADPWPIVARVPLPLEDDTEAGMTRATAGALAGFVDVFERSRPDLVVVLGDRFETFAAAIAAYLARIPIAHLHGGELTFGALDDGMRHAITKLATLHFASTEEYATRIVRMGEEPARVFTVGALGVDNALAEPQVPRAELEADLGIALGVGSMLVTFHPATVAGEAAVAEVRELTTALGRFAGWRALVTRPNADAHGRGVAAELERWVAERPGERVLVDSLGTRRYLSAARAVAVVVGNSSSGIIEVPVLGTPVVDIGDRQEGRVRPAGVVHCDAEADAIEAAVREAISPAFVLTAHAAAGPYGDGHAAGRIAAALEGWLAGDRSVKKRFHEEGER